MKRLIKGLLRKPTIRLAGRLGLDVQNRNNPGRGIDKNFLLNGFFQLLQDCQFCPEHIVDIGANRGTWTRRALKYFPEAKYSLFEPQAWMKDDLKDILHAYPKVAFYPVGVGAHGGDFKFTIVDRDDSCSFRYSEQEADARGFKQIDIPMVRLDDFLHQYHFPIPDVIKIDAEGLDLEVLSGVGNCLGTTEVILVEASVNNKSLSNSLYHVIQFMEERGYRLFDITDMNRPFHSKLLWLMEVVFVRKNGYLDHLVQDEAYRVAKFH